MKKFLAGLIPPKVETEKTAVAKSVAKAPPKATDFVGQKQAYTVFIYFPEYGELADFISDEARRQFMAAFRKAIDNALEKIVSVVNITGDAQATIAIEDSAKQPQNTAMKAINEIYHEVQLWVGTFGRIGIPTMKFRMGVARGNVLLAIENADAPTITGPSIADAQFIARQFCAEFDVKLGVSGEIVRGSNDSINWLDLDDVSFNADNISKVVRLFTKLADRLDPDDIQMARAARKAYYLQNWDESLGKFTRLRTVKNFNHIATLYLARIDELSRQPRAAQWDGVYRLNSPK